MYADVWVMIPVEGGVKKIFKSVERSLVFGKPAVESDAELSLHRDFGVLVDVMSVYKQRKFLPKILGNRHPSEPVFYRSCISQSLADAFLPSSLSRAENLRRLQA